MENDTLFSILTTLAQNKESKFSVKELEDRLPIKEGQIKKIIYNEKSEEVPRFDAKKNGKKWEIQINSYGISVLESIKIKSAEKAKNIKLMVDKKNQEAQERMEREKDENRIASIMEVYIYECILNDQIDASVSDDLYNNHLIRLDMQKLSEFDTKTYDYALEEPENFSNILSELGIQISGTYELNPTVEFLVYNFYDSDTIPLSMAKRTDKLGKLVAFDGIITKISDVFSRPTIIKYECDVCGDTTIIICDPLSKYIPTIYSCSSCGSKKIIIASKKVVNVQYMEIQEEGATNPRSVTVMIRNNRLCEEITPDSRSLRAGNRVKIYGQPQLMNVHEGRKVVANSKIIIDCWNYEVEKSFTDINLSDKDIESIKKLSENPALPELILKTIAPHIYGMDDIKEGVSAMLFGGVRHPNSRGEINVLLMGDPSVGKTQIMSSVEKISPRFIRADGTGASSVGLTAAVRKDEMTGEYCLEAGALVLANGGGLGIDEFDKLESDSATHLNGAMESQEFTINKAGINARVKTSCYVLACANPKYETFDRSDSLVSQVNISDTLFSRFDLKYMITDNINEEKDKSIVTSMLSDNKNETTSIISTELMKKYIIYAKRINPEMTENAEFMIRDIYLHLRKYSEGKDYKIKTREISTIIRISEACARQRLSETVEPIDVERAKNILFSCIENMCGSKIEDCDFSQYGLGRRTDKILKNDIDKAKAIIDKHKELLVMDFIDKLTEIGIKDTDKVIEQLEKEKHMMESPKGTYRVV